MPTIERKPAPKQIIQMMNNSKKKKAQRYVFRKHTAQYDAMKNVRRVLDPSNSGFFPEYVDDWGGFIEKELGGTMPEMLQGLVETIMNHRVTVVPSGTQLGKSWIGSQLALAFYKIYEESQVYIMAAPPKGNLLNNLMSKIRAATFMNKGLFAKDLIKVMKIEREGAPDQFIEGLVIPTQGTDEEKETKFSGKHAPYMLVILDEGDGIPDFVFKAVDGWGSGGILFRVVVFFNPKDKLGEAYNLIERATFDDQIAIYRLCAFDHPNVVSGTQVIPGAVSREQTVKRISEWTFPIEESEAFVDGAVEPSEDCFELPDFLIGEQYGDYEALVPGWYKVKPEHPEFSYKVLGRYPISGMAVSIPEEWLQLAIARFDRYARELVQKHGRMCDQLTTGPSIMGVDLSDSGADDNVICNRWNGYTVFEKWKGNDANKAVNRTINLWYSLKEPPERTVVDKSGVGAIAPGKMAEQNRDGIRITGVRGWLSQKKSTRRAEEGRFKKKRDEALWAVREWFNPNNNHMPMLDKTEKRLLQSLRALRHETKGDDIEFITKEKLKSQLGYSPGELDSLMLTLARAGTVFEVE